MGFTMALTYRARPMEIGDQMIESDKGKPMSILELISDEPCEPEPYIDYLLDHYRAHRDYWGELPNDRDADKPTARECVLLKIDFFIMELGNIKRKMHRPSVVQRSEQPPAADAVGQRDA